MSALNQDERDIVALTGAFVDERVRPRVRDYEAGDTYPAEFIDEMKKLGFFGLLAPAEYGGVDVSATGAARTLPATDGRPHAQGHDGAHRAGRRSDLQAMRTAMQVALDAMPVHGGYGFSKEFEVERYFRDARLMILGEDTNEIQRNVIAAQLIAHNPHHVSERIR